MNRSPERVDDLERHPPCPGPLDQAAFRSQRRAGNQQHVVAELPLQAFAGEQRIFLRSAQDESRNDMGDAHAIRSEAKQPFEITTNPHGAMHRIVGGPELPNYPPGSSYRTHNRHKP